MSDEKKRGRVANIGDRRLSAVGQAVRSAILKDQPTIGGNQGDYVRPKCGTCLSWRRDSRAGQGGIPLEAGQCMFGPPTPHPIMDETGAKMMGTICIRPPMASNQEGCDQHDDGTDDDGDGEDVAERTGSLIATG